jgi:hypothetical protein
MTIDERLEALVVRQESLTQSVELLHVEVRQMSLIVRTCAAAITDAAKRLQSIGPFDAEGSSR